MTPDQVEIQLIAAVVAVACSLLGVFLVLRRMALLSDAISHAILLGIVLGFFLVRDLASPILVAGATLAGVLTVSLVELLNRTRLVKEDAAIGLVFPLLFSLGVILITRNAGNVHLDTDAVLLGELAFAPEHRLHLGSWSIPQSLFVMSCILLLNVAFIGLFYKELKLATFDAALAASLGFAPWLLHYVLMTLVSITAVGAFDAVGSVLVVALMIGPPAAAYLLTDRLFRMLLLSTFFALLSATAGYWLAHYLDASIAGAVAAMTGLIFGVVFLLAPQYGLLALGLRRLRQRWEFARTMLAIHLLNHEGLPEADVECRLDHLHEHLRWKPAFIRRVVRTGVRYGIITLQSGRLHLTTAGRQLAREALVH